jgi:hypothetical protein
VTEQQIGPLERRWLDRYARRMMDRAGLTEEQARACAEAESFEVLSESFEDDPEGAADMELSYWDE